MSNIFTIPGRGGGGTVILLMICLIVGEWEGVGSPYVKLRNE